MRHLVYRLLIGCSVVFGSFAQEYGAVYAQESGGVTPEQPPNWIRTTIESTGVATLTAPVGEVEFRFVRYVEASSFSGAIEAAENFKQKAQQAFEDQETPILDVTFSGVSVPATGTPAAEITATAVFDAARFKNPQTGARAFGELCDTMYALGQSLGCRTEGPLLNAADPELVEQAAVGRAVENAHPLAEAAAQIMGGFLAVVEHIRVIEAAWGTSEEPGVASPDIKTTTCTAKVSVLYTFSPGQP